jgi:hypothetical protein
MSSTDDYPQSDDFSFSRDERNRQADFQPDSWLSLEVYIKANQPELLTGLDQWLQLNLISEAQVKKLCRNHLSCSLPIREIVALAPEITSQTIVATEQTVVVADVPTPNILARLWQGLLDELSIRWLLFLGIFLVIISSGVLAASQWHNFPHFGQYLILLIYTLGFWGISFWSSKQESLRLTSQTLNGITTLLVPINFWAISQFSLGKNIGEVILIVMATITLTSTIYLASRLKTHSNHRLILPLFLILSYFHLGWHFSLVPLIAVYVGIIAISCLYYRLALLQFQYSLINFLFLLAAWSLLLARGLSNSFTTNYFPQYSFAITPVAYAYAIALLGWLLATIDLTRARQIKLEESAEHTTELIVSKVWQFISIFILFFAWIVSVIGGIWLTPLFFWQTFGINVLAIHLFSQRLTLTWRKRDLTAIFFLGLQTLYLSKELIPVSFRTQALDLAVNISKTEYLPESVLGVTLFPYVILFVFVATWLYRRQKLNLAIYAEYLTLLLGIALTCLSFSNPIWRSLNLFLSTLTLGYVSWIRQPARISLIYATHLLGLVTVVNIITVNFPNLSQSIWGSILVLLMTVEWYIYLRQVKQPRSRWRSSFLSLLKQSCWYFGLLLAASSYVCFLASIQANVTPNTWRWGLIWLITPGSLTLIAKYTRKLQQRRLVTYLSCLALIIAQLLIYGRWETRLLGLAVAVGLMFFNAYHLRRTIITVIHLGFCLGLIANLFSLVVSGWNWLVVGAVAILGLYQSRQYLQQINDTPKFDYISQRTAHGILGVGIEAKNYKLIGKYILATDYWAIALITVEIIGLSLIYSRITEVNADIQYLLSIILITTAIIWRYRQQPNNLVLYTLVWLGELLGIGVTFFLGGNGLTGAITNIVMGFLALGLVRWLTLKTSAWAELNLTHLPLIYAGLGILWRLSYFNASTGWLTLGAALILINTQQNNHQLVRTNAHSPLQAIMYYAFNLNWYQLTSYLGFAGITFGIYEIVIYQMQQSSGESFADGLTILALVAAAIAFCYRLGVWWYRQRQQTTFWHLSLTQVTLIAHLHWAISSILKIIAAGIAIESATPRLTYISIATSFCLGAYALIQGRDRHPETTSNKVNDWWVYVGLVEITATLVYSRLIISRLSLFDPWRIIFTCAVALAIYQIPWQNLGWRVTPWQHTALIMPALMALVTAEDISYFSLLVTAIFYLRIAYVQQNLRWSYISLGFINWATIRWVWQYNTEFIWLAGIISLSILYIAQVDPYLKSHRQPRHYVRLLGSSILCITALFYQDLGIIPGVISFGLIFIGLGLKIRAFLFAGTITLILTAIYQLIILVVINSFFKWIIGLLAGICSIIIAAKFEQKRDYTSRVGLRDRLNNQLQNYASQLEHWQ